MSIIPHYSGYFIGRSSLLRHIRPASMKTSETNLYEVILLKD